MPDKLLQVKTDRPGSSTVTLIDREPSTTGYRLMALDLGNANFDKVFAGMRGTQGAALVGENAQNRVSTWTLEVVGTSMDDFMAKASVLYALDEELRAFGGTVTWRAQGSTYRMKIKVLDSGVNPKGLDRLWEHNFRSQFDFAVVSEPYMQGESMDIFDDFSADSEANYTFDSGSAGDVSISPLGVPTGVLHADANLTTEKRMIHTDRGYTYGDVQAQILFAPGTTITSFKAGIILKRIDAANYLEVYVDDNGTNSRLRLDKVVAGARTNLSTTNLAARITTGGGNWIRGRIEGNVVFLDYALGAQTLITTPTLTANVTLAGADATQFGAGAVGRVGFSWIPQSSNASIGDFAVEAYVRRLITTPATIQFNGPIPGDAPALSKILVGTVAGGPQIPFALIGWTRSSGSIGNAPFGVLQAEAAGLTTWVATADANYFGGNGAKFTVAGAANLTATFSIDLHALEPDEYRDEEVEIEIWGRFELASTLANPTVIVRGGWTAGVSSSGYTAEYGTAGKRLVLPSSGTQFRFVRLGTLTVPYTTNVIGTINVNATTTGGSGQFGLDYVVMVRANSRVVSPTAKVYDSTYPPFFTAGGMKVISPDLAGRALLLTAPDVALWDTGVGGSLIELPPGPIDLTAKLSSLVPDDPTANTSSETASHAASIQLRDVRPRWRLGR